VSESPASLERVLARLDAIVESLQRDDLELEEALNLFEEGIVHVRAARKTLDVAQLRIDRLIEEQGEVTIQPMPRTPE
jgi:exodeoxyribonuclease VII small subunit